MPTNFTNDTITERVWMILEPTFSRYNGKPDGFNVSLRKTKPKGAKVTMEVDLTVPRAAFEPFVVPVAVDVDESDVHVDVAAGPITVLVEGPADDE